MGELGREEGAGRNSTIGRHAQRVGASSREGPRPFSAITLLSGDEFPMNSWPTSENPGSRHSGEAIWTVPHPPKLQHTGQTLNARGFAYATCCALQPLVAHPCKGRGVGLVSTADVLLTKRPTLRLGAFRFYGICRQERGPTSGLEPLTCSLRVSACTQKAA